MPATAMNHFTVLTDDVSTTVAFYRDLLGLTEGPRPPFDFPGAWLYAADTPILHVIGGRSPDELRAALRVIGEQIRELTRRNAPPLRF